jgi:hypothetical protein
MARPKRRGRDRRLSVEQLSSEMLMTLVCGRGYFERYSAEDVRAAFEEHGQWILETWIDHFPGSRPFGFYLCAGVPEFGERQVVGDLTQEARETISRYGVLHTFTISPTQEPEVEYLRRHGQLGDDEEAALTRGEGVGDVSGYCSGALDVLLGQAKEEALLAED